MGVFEYTPFFMSTTLFEHLSVLIVWVFIDY